MEWEWPAWAVPRWHVAAEAVARGLMQRGGNPPTEVTVNAVRALLGREVRCPSTPVVQEVRHAAATDEVSYTRVVRTRSGRLRIR